MLTILSHAHTVMLAPRQLNVLDLARSGSAISQRYYYIKKQKNAATFSSTDEGGDTIVMEICKVQTGVKWCDRTLKE